MTAIVSENKARISVKNMAILSNCQQCFARAIVKSNCQEHGKSNCQEHGKRLVASQSRGFAFFPSLLKCLLPSQFTAQRAPLSRRVVTVRYDGRCEVTGRRYPNKGEPDPAVAEGELSVGDKWNEALSLSLNDVNVE